MAIKTKSGRKTYTPQFKEGAVKAAKELGNVSAAARQLGVSQSLLRSWIVAAESTKMRGGGLAAALEEKARIAKLERDYAALKEENAILKKATAYFAQSHLSRNTPSSSAIKKSFP
jgi:transposase